MLSHYNDFGAMDGDYQNPQAVKGWCDDEIAPEGEVTVNFNVNSGELELRKGIAEQSDSTKLIESIVMGPPAIDILPGEVVFSYRNPNRGVGNRVNYGGYFNNYTSMCVFSSLNGLPAPATDAELRNTFKVQGFAKIGYSYDPEYKGKNNGVAVRAKGSGTTGNRGWSTFYPGDSIATRFHSVDPKIRAEELRTIPKFQGLPTGKTPVILYKKTLKSAKTFLSEAVDQLLIDSNDPLMLHTLIEGSDLPNDSAVSQLALVTARKALYDAWVVVCTLAQYGLVTINVPSGTDPLSTVNYGKFDSVLNATLNTINKSKVEKIPSPDGNGTAKLTLNPLSDSDRLKMLQEFKFLAGKVGLFNIAGGDVDHVAPNNNLVSALLGRIHYSVIPDPREAAVFSMSRVLPKTEKYKRSNTNGGTSFNINSVWGQILAHEADSFSTFTDGVQLAVDLDREQVLATATSHSLPGDKVDYVR